MLRIVIADDHSIVRWALKELLEKSDGIEVVGEASTGIEVMAILAQTRPDVLLLDLSMPDMDGYQVLEKMPEVSNNTRVLVLTMHEDASYGVRAARRGAAGYMQKTEDPDVLLPAIRTVANGGTVFSSQIRELSADDRAGASHPAHVLSQRELEVMGFLARGLTNREIAEKLAISVKTVDTHRGHVLKKLNLRNNSDITRFALTHGYVPAASAAH
jgi:DNA-binding NarL/FixJ family response regulator